MQPEGWAVVAAGGSAVAAFASLGVAWHAKQIQGHSTDFTNCLQVVGQLREATHRVLFADDDEKRHFEFIELLNLLEVLALLYNDGKIASSTNRFTRKFLIESLASIRASEVMSKLKQESITAEETYQEI